MPGRRRRRRSGRGRKPARSLGMYVDVINTNIPVDTSIGYKTTDVRFNSDRSYRISHIVAWLVSKGPAVAQISIQNANSRLATRESSSSGPVPIGVIPQKVFVRNKDQVFIPAGNSADLFNVDNICISKDTNEQFHIIGSVYVYILYEHEMLAEACPTVWTPENHPGTSGPYINRTSTSSVQSFAADENICGDSL